MTDWEYMTRNLTRDKKREKTVEKQVWIARSKTRGNPEDNKSGNIYEHSKVYRGKASATTFFNLNGYRMINCLKRNVVLGYKKYIPTPWSKIILKKKG